MLCVVHSYHLLASLSKNILTPTQFRIGWETKETLVSRRQISSFHFSQSTCTVPMKLLTEESCLNHGWITGALPATIGLEKLTPSKNWFTHPSETGFCLHDIVRANLADKKGWKKEGNHCFMISRLTLCTDLRTRTKEDGKLSRILSHSD